MNAAVDKLVAGLRELQVDAPEHYGHQEPNRTADPNARKPLTAKAVGFDDFHAYLPEHRYIFVPTRDLWPAQSVNVRCSTPRRQDGQPVSKMVPRKGPGGVTMLVPVPMSPSEYLDEYRSVDQMTWAPGEPLLIENRLVSGGGWIERSETKAFNLYRGPTIKHGD